MVFNNNFLTLIHQFHRDFLDPLLPVYAFEFQNLSRHDISYDDLEVNSHFPTDLRS